MGWDFSVRLRLGFARLRPASLQLLAVLANIGQRFAGPASRRLRPASLSRATADYKWDAEVVWLRPDSLRCASSWLPLVLDVG